MNKVLSFLFVGILAVSMVACGGEKKDEAAPAEGAAATADTTSHEGHAH